jgi:hypothetical protein
VRGGGTSGRDFGVPSEYRGAAEDREPVIFTLHPGLKIQALESPPSPPSPLYSLAWCCMERRAQHNSFVEIINTGRLSASGIARMSS